MKITIRLAKALARHADNKKVIACDLLEENKDLSAVIETLERQFPGLEALICDKENQISDSVNIYVNGDNVRYLEGLNTLLKEGDVVNIIPAAAAG
jgi:molybdopterin synthase sulfur carrier subunit